MLPRALKQKYRLTYAQLATLLAKDTRTVERYCNCDRVPENIQNYCYLLDYYLHHQRQLPPYALLPGLEVQA